jgi:flagellar hook assembly protein FlgD
VKDITYFTVKIEKASKVSVEVYNVMGQKVMSMDKGVTNAGTHQYSIDGSQLTSGVYFYTVNVNGSSYTHKMIVE